MTETTTSPLADPLTDKRDALATLAKNATDERLTAALQALLGSTPATDYSAREQLDRALTPRKRRNGGGSTTLLSKALRQHMMRHTKGITVGAVLEEMKAQGSVSHNVEEAHLVRLLQKSPKVYSKLEPGGEWIYRLHLKRPAAAA